MLEFVEEMDEEGIKRNIYVFSDEKLQLLRAQIRAFKKSLDTLDFPEENTFIIS